MILAKVISGGTQTTVQDAGRPGHRHHGVPHGGAADRLSFAIANYLVGNRWDAPALECALGGLHLKFDRDCVISVCGAEMWAQINGMNIQPWTSFGVEAGDVLTLSQTRAGCRAYIAVQGGWAGEIFLGSVSTLLLAGQGGIEGRPLRGGDELAGAGLDHNGPEKLPKGYQPHLSHHVVLRARSGPEWDAMSADSQRYLFTTPFVATSATDRMGTRLRGDRIETDQPMSLTSAPLLPGSLQVPPDGQAILALIDGHCTGGYPRALQVIQADHWLMGQIAPGSLISFRRNFADEAPDILRSRQAFYGGLMDGFTF